MAGVQSRTYGRYSQPTRLKVPSFQAYSRPQPNAINSPVADLEIPPVSPYRGPYVAFPCPGTLSAHKRDSAQFCCTSWAAAPIATKEGYGAKASETSAGHRQMCRGQPRSRKVEARLQPCTTTPCGPRCYPGPAFNVHSLPPTRNLLLTTPSNSAQTPDPTGFQRKRLQNNTSTTIIAPIQRLPTIAKQFQRQPEPPNFYRSTSR